MWREQAILEWSWHLNSIVACCHNAKLCAYAARDFQSQQNGAVSRMWRSCGVQPSHKERAIGAVRCKKEGMLLQPLRWCCVDCVIHHERDVREEQHHTYIYVARTSNNRVIMAWTLLLLAATVRSFAHMPLGISDGNTSPKKIWGGKVFDFRQAAIFLVGTMLHKAQNESDVLKIGRGPWSPGYAYGIVRTTPFIPWSPWIGGGHVTLTNQLWYCLWKFRPIIFFHWSGS